MISPVDKIMLTWNGNKFDTEQDFDTWIESLPVNTVVIGETHDSQQR